MKTLLITALLLTLACGPPEPLDRLTDGGPRPSGDAALQDAQLVADVPSDAAAQVDAAPDAGRRDALFPDLGRREAGPPDVQGRDAGRPEAGRSEAGAPEAGLAEAGVPEAGLVDSGLADSGLADSGLADAGRTDSGPSFGCGDYPNCRSRANWHAGLRQHHMQDTQGCSFGLVPPSAQDWADGRARALNLATRLGGAVSIAHLLGDLNRQGRSSITNQSATRLRNHQWQGWIWNTGDNAVGYWYPQGITGSSDSVGSGLIMGRRLQLISWYHKTEARPTKGVRVSLADLTNMRDVDYRHMMLVIPYGDDDLVNFRPLHKSLTNNDALHAGGIVWYGDYLYVADTANGFRVFDMSLIARVSNTDDTSNFGRDGEVTHAFGYRYIVPQIARYDAPENACDFSFSFVSLDRGSNPPALLTGEYKSDSIQGRLVNYLLDAQTHKLQVRGGEIRGQEAKMGAQTKMQGAARWQNNYYISSSSQAGSFGRLYRTRSGRESSISAWVYGAEDLYYERTTGVIWTAAEHPDFRDVVGIPLLVP